MKRILILATALFAILAVTGAPASAANKGLKGTWQVKYYSKGGKLRATQCIWFVQTNNIAGYTKFSGTWTAIGVNNLAGQWVQNGDDIMWYGVSGNDAFFSVGNLTTKKDIGGVGYAQFRTTNSATLQAGNWTAKKKNCQP